MNVNPSLLLLHNLFKIDWRMCKNSRRPFFLLALHQYLKTKPEAPQTKRLLSDEMSPGEFLCSRKLRGGSTLPKITEIPTAPPTLARVVLGERVKESGELFGLLDCWRVDDGLVGEMVTDGSGLSRQ